MRAIFGYLARVIATRSELVRKIERFLLFLRLEEPLETLCFWLVPEQGVARVSNHTRLQLQTVQFKRHDRSCALIIFDSLLVRRNDQVTCRHRGIFEVLVPDATCQCP